MSPFALKVASRTGEKGRHSRFYLVVLSSLNQYIRRVSMEKLQCYQFSFVTSFIYICEYIYIYVYVFILIDLEFPRPEAQVRGTEIK